MSETPLLVFAKAPVPGEVKTRLIGRLGIQGAAALHRALVLYQLRQAVAAAIGPVELWCAPDCLHPFFTECAAEFGVTLRPQHGADLGARMQHALSDALRRADQAVLIGSDLPALDAIRLREAASYLREGDAILVPTEDGGYGLIGLRRSEPRLFSDVPWGTDSVLAVTEQRLAALKLRWSRLSMSWDVDRPDDLARLKEFPELAGLSLQ